MKDGGEAIAMRGGKLVVPDRPVLPFIEGDGTGPDIWRASVRVFDAAVREAYGGRREIVWREVLAGQKAFDRTGSWLPDETLDAALAVARSARGIRGTRGEALDAIKALLAEAGA